MDGYVTTTKKCNLTTTNQCNVTITKSTSHHIPEQSFYQHLNYVHMNNVFIRCSVDIGKQVDLVMFF